MDKKTYITSRRTMFKGMVFLLLMQGCQIAFAAEGGVEYRIAWDANDSRYHVYMRPTSTPDPDLSLTAQVTLRVPHATAGNRFQVTDIQPKPGTVWKLGSNVPAPVENPLYDYLSFNYDAEDVHAFVFKAGEEQEVFSFRNKGPCVGDVELIDNATDPFSQPSGNSVGTNPRNQFSNTGWGSINDNDYRGNYGEPASCNAGCGNTPAAPLADHVYYRVAWNISDQRYHVYMYPGSTPTRNLSLTGQVTLKMPHAANAADSFKTTGIQSTSAAIEWKQSSRVNAPTEDTESDYLSFTMNLSDPQALQWQADQELEVFSFANSNACLGPVVLMKDSDPFNAIPNSADTNPGNQFTNLGWGSADKNNYAGNYGCEAVCIDPELDSDNDGLTDAQEAEIGTDPQNPDTDTDTLLDGEEVARGANPLKADIVRLQARVMLQGAYDSKTQLMRDTLRANALIPAQEPYGITSNTASDTAASNLLGSSGNDAPVDWVVIELLDPNNPTITKARLTGLVQRDADIVDAQSGDGSFLLIGVEPGSYYVAVKHRNHLGVMTANPVALGGVPAMIDFTKESTSTYGSHARVSLGGTALLWAGNNNNDGLIISQGPSNDLTQVLSNILATEGNVTYNTNYKLSGYRATDINMDGITIFAGPSNDVDLALGNVLTHPANISFSSNYIIRQQLP